MAQQTINLGTIANDGTGDSLRDGGDKINDNFTELYQGVGAGINSQSGTSYTLVLSDAGKVIILTNASEISLTIPDNSDVAFPVNTVIEIHQGGAGRVVFVEDTSVTILSRDSMIETAGQEAVAAIRKIATDTWRLTGDIAASS